MYGARQHPDSGRPYGRPPADAGQDRQRAAEASRSAALRGVPTRSARESGAEVHRDTIRFSGEERKAHSDRAQIFSLLVMADRLERVWTSGGVSDEEYEQAIRKLISQYKTSIRAFSSSVPDISEFGKTYRCDAALGAEMGYHRLVVAGIPATVEEGTPNKEEQKKQMQRVHECTQAFIGLMDNFELGHSKVEELISDARSLYSALCHVEGLETGFVFKEQLRGWIGRLQGMNALAELDEEDRANFKLQVGIGYDDYSDFIRAK